MSQLRRILFFFLFLQALVVNGQRITGVVTDAETGDSIPMASIVYKGHHVAVISSANGHYSIERHEGWNITFSSGYDFEASKISMTTASLSRDLHCFAMSCSVVLTPYASYNFSFRCNASTLTDVLKYDKRSGSTNTVQWY